MYTFAKRFISILLVLVLLSSFATTAYATDGDIEPRIDFVASMTIVAFSTNDDSHAFLVFKNMSNSTITIGHMPVDAGDSITIGTFGNRAAHRGIWYNIEGYHNPSSVTTYGMTNGVTRSELTKINQTINANDRWSLANNCTTFAIKVWNSGNVSQPLTGGNPSALIVAMNLTGNRITNPTVPQKSINQIARHTATSYSYDPSGAIDSGSSS